MPADVQAETAQQQVADTSKIHEEQHTVAAHREVVEDEMVVVDTRNTWIDVKLPLDDFYLTNQGRIVELDTDMSDKIESVGISVARVNSSHPVASANLSSRIAEAGDSDCDSLHDERNFCLDIHSIWLERQGLKRRAERKHTTFS